MLWTCLILSYKHYIYEWATDIVWLYLSVLRYGLLFQY